MSPCHYPPSWAASLKPSSGCNYNISSRNWGRDASDKDASAMAVCASYFFISRQKLEKIREKEPRYLENKTVKTVQMRQEDSLYL